MIHYVSFSLSGDTQKDDGVGRYQARKLTIKVEEELLQEGPHNFSVSTTTTKRLHLQRLHMKIEH